MLDRFDMLMFAVAGYVAIVTLVRLMITRRDEVVGYLRTDLERQAAEAAAAEEDEERDAA